jgi:Methyltransferase domain
VESWLRERRPPYIAFLQELCMPQETALVFPATLVDALRFSERSRRAGWRVIGGSSVPAEGAEAFYDSWVEIPFVYEEGFAQAFSAIVAREKVAKVFSSHEVVWRHLQRVLPELCPGVHLEIVEQDQGDQSFLQLIAESYATYRALAADLGNSDPVTELEHRATLTRAFQIRGQSGVHKLSCMMAAMGSAPAGDVVEIGTFTGRSAFVLGWIARRCQIGSVLCIDPWTNEGAMQHDAPDVLRQVSGGVDYGAFFDEFRLNLLPSFHADLNYAREAASAVRSRFDRDFSVGPTEFGTTRYLGEIAFLHIDGNHDFAAVSEDVASWSGLVRPTGWIIVDDYVWPFGDGPRQVADRLLANDPSAFERAFVVDGALFLRRAAA